MSLFDRLFGRTEPAAIHSTQHRSTDLAEAPDARTWLRTASERDNVWRDFGNLRLPSRRIFVGDPTNGHDGHMENVATIELDALRVWVLEAGPDRNEFEAHRNALVWLEARGTRPVARGRSLDFGVDAACFAIGDGETGDAFKRLTDLELDAGRGDNFEWILPFIQERPHYAGWLEIPPNGHPMFVASTGDDGGFAAVWLHDESDDLSGILVDIAGRESDSLFLDRLLPNRISATARPGTE
jgi:hypothetical protein